MRLKVGDRAPDFALTAHTGERMELAQFRGKSVVVLYFYPKDGTPICTKQACAFRDHYEQFTEAGAVVIGISSDSPERHNAFVSSRGLPFLLLSDTEGHVQQLYGVPKLLGLLGSRVTFVIDTEGFIRLAFRAQMLANRHVAEAVKAVNALVSSS